MSNIAEFCEFMSKTLEQTSQGGAIRTFDGAIIVNNNDDDVMLKALDKNTPD